MTNEPRRLGRRIGRGAFVAALATGVTLAGSPAFAGSAEDWKIVAHRGGMANGVQHSMTLLTEMLKVRADAVEVDVVMTKDRVPLLFHADHELSKLTTNCSGRVSRQTWSQLDRCILRNPFGSPAYNNQRLVKLNTAMRLFDRNAPRGFQVFLHIKSINREQARKIANVVQRYDIQDDTIPISGSTTMLKYFRDEGLKKQGLVFNSTAGWDTNYKFLIPYNVTTNSSLIRAAHRNNQKVLPVESHPHSLAALDKVDVDGVLANNLIEALVRAGRLVSTSSAKSESSQPDVPASGPSRTTGPMDF